jgi:nucleotide-binding universal stress UspA family protein
MSNSTATTPAVVVGVDGSEGSKAALRWAARQAELTGAPLRAVFAWQFPNDYGLGAISGVETVLPTTGNVNSAARKALEQVVADVLGPDRSAAVTVAVVDEPAAAVLLAAAKGAALLVVGSSGHGELVGMVLGSVSAHCVTHATCPVVVVPATGHRGKQGAS